ncbi:methionine--tRNA ligase mes1 [Hanseniaspora osmophila]|uniref:methionine--tRNA ligase n=1 Tax=Hanseniaspora osmophila TaxID=56408 RepID=A0A1E5RHT1_9ASCO|nr:Methionine--tRNA ligase, cytoplasmic [Hanseniaspora osmophila]
MKVTFDKNRNHSLALQKANNLKIALSLIKNPKLSVDEEAAKNTGSQLVDEKTGFALFNTNAILQYVFQDFSIKHPFAITNLEPILQTTKENNQHVEELVKKTIENYLSSDFDVNASNLIMFANAYALDFTNQFKNVQLPSVVQEALAILAKTMPRDSAQFKHTKASNIKQGHYVEIPKAGEKILPKENEKNILVTSALPYVNNVPHLGNIVGSVLSADIYARYCKSRNYNTLYICGTDEYGTATETKALEEKVSPKELCDKYHKIHAQVYDWFQIGFDHFGRTTTEQQTEIAQDILKKLEANGYLEEQSMKQLFCPVHKAFLADRYVEGTCPKCGYEDARGDQCDKCGGLLDPFELINPRCKLDNATPEPRVSDHIFLSLNKLENNIADWFEDSSTKGKWSKNAKTITKSWLKEGLNPRCITRDLVWGTPVPFEKFKNKVLYVWFDAPIGYVSITANYTEDWTKWWKNPENVKLYQFMGKDNVPFHSVIFPGSQLGTNENWTMLNHLNTTEYLQYEGGKFSKSRGVGVFGNNAQDIGVSPSVWRYYLASVRPETSDSQFSWSDFVARNNSELLANLGNFVNRLVKFVNAKYNGVVPKYDISHLPNFDALSTDINTILKQYIEVMELAQEKRGLELAMSLSARGNQFLQENKLDNSLFNDSPDKSDAVVGVGLNIINTLASVIYPFMPETSEKIYKMLNVPALKIDDTFHLTILGGHNINKAEYLFTRIDEKKIDEWRSKYSGQQVK